jgi:hypothetical protein
VKKEKKEFVFFGWRRQDRAKIASYKMASNLHCMAPDQKTKKKMNGQKNCSLSDNP